MNATPERALDWIAASGLLVGAGFGLAGTFVGSPHLQASLWAIDSVGLVIATTLLALKFFRAGVDVVAGGFLVFAIGEGVLLSGTAAGPSASVPAFAAGTALWAAALALISAPRRLPSWLRLLGGGAACLFAVTAARIYAGEALLPTSSPLPFLAYPSSSRPYWGGHGCWCAKNRQGTPELRHGGVESPRRWCVSEGSGCRQRSTVAKTIACS
jgi:hypothetical protein